MIIPTIYNTCERFNIQCTYGTDKYSFAQEPVIVPGPNTHSHAIQTEVNGSFVQTLLWLYEPLQGGKQAQAAS